MDPCTCFNLKKLFVKLLVVFKKELLLIKKPQASTDTQGLKEAYGLVTNYRIRGYPYLFYRVYSRASVRKNSPRACA